MHAFTTQLSGGALQRIGSMQPMPMMMSMDNNNNMLPRSFDQQNRLKSMGSSGYMAA